MKNLILGIILGAAVSAVAAPSYAPKSFHVGIGKPAVSRGHRMLAASTSSGTLSVTRAQSCTLLDGSATVTLNYTNASNTVVVTRTISFPANRTNAVTDQFGNVIAATVPAATATAIDSFGSNLDTQIGSAATAGKLNL